ncbi:unnamed protein product [Lampetra planeri]
MRPSNRASQLGTGGRRPEPAGARAVPGEAARAAGLSSSVIPLRPPPRGAPPDRRHRRPRHPSSTASAAPRPWPPAHAAAAAVTNGRF